MYFTENKIQFRHSKDINIAVLFYEKKLKNWMRMEQRRAAVRLRVVYLYLT